MKNQKQLIYNMVYTAMFAAIVYVGTIIRIPLGESKLSIANVLCVLSGLMLPPVGAGLASGIGSAIYDITLGGYGALDVGITFVSKFLMAAVGALLKLLYNKYVSKEGNSQEKLLRYIVIIASAVIAIAAYLLRTTIEGITVYGYEFAIVAFACFTLNYLIEKKPLTIAFPIAFIAIYMLQGFLDSYTVNGFVVVVVMFVWFVLRFFTRRKEAVGDGYLSVISAIAAITYVLLYMLKTFVKGLTVDGLELSATYVKMGAKLPASLINAVLATILAPKLYLALSVSLKKQGIGSGVFTEMK